MWGRDHVPLVSGTRDRLIGLPGSNVRGAMEPARRQPVVDVALQGDAAAVDAQAVECTRPRGLRVDGLRFWDNVYRWLTWAAAVSVLVILGGVIISLIIGSLPALREFGFSFVTEQRWNPV